jgi:hypothetical protein
LPGQREGTAGAGHETEAQRGYAKNETAQAENGISKGLRIRHDLVYK